MHTPDAIDFSTADYIDSRDVTARLDYLGGTDALNNPDTDEDDQDEIRELIAFAKEAQDHTDEWEYGAQIIADDYFTDYAKQLAEDIGAIAEDAPWPARHIDWDAAADELKQDYSSFTAADRTWWTR